MEDVGGGGEGGDGWKTNTTLYVRLGFFFNYLHTSVHHYFIQGCQKVLK